MELEWQVYNKAQAAWRLQASDGKERHEWLEQCRQAAQEQKAAGEAGHACHQSLQDPYGLLCSMVLCTVRCLFHSISMPILTIQKQ